MSSHQPLRSYYKTESLETIDVISEVTRDLRGEQAFCLGNIIKYVSRAEKKHATPNDDLDKARAYANRLCCGLWSLE